MPWSFDNAGTMDAPFASSELAGAAAFPAAGRAGIAPPIGSLSSSSGLLKAASGRFGGTTASGCDRPAGGIVAAADSCSAAGSSCCISTGESFPVEVSSTLPALTKLDSASSPAALSSAAAAGSPSISATSDSAASSPASSGIASRSLFVSYSSAFCRRCSRNRSCSSAFLPIVLSPSCFRLSFSCLTDIVPTVPP